MATAIYVRGARNVVLDNVVIRGFDKGIVLEDTYATLNRVYVTQTNIGLLARKNYALINQSLFLDNAIDILAENASLDMIDTIARTIKAYLSNINIIHYTVNPYRLIAQANEVLQEQNPEIKRRKFRELLETMLKYAAYAKTIYDIIKAVLRAIGIHLP